MTSDNIVEQATGIWPVNNVCPRRTFTGDRLQTAPTRFAHVSSVQQRRRHNVFAPYVFAREQRQSFVGIMHWMVTAPLRGSPFGCGLTHRFWTCYVVGRMTIRTPFPCKWRRKLE